MVQFEMGHSGLYLGLLVEDGALFVMILGYRVAELINHLLTKVKEGMV